MALIERFFALLFNSFCVLPNNYHSGQKRESKRQQKRKMRETGRTREKQRERRNLLKSDTKIVRTIWPMQYLYRGKEKECN